jgi:adenine deaminase
MNKNHDVEVTVRIRLLKYFKGLVFGLSIAVWASAPASAAPFADTIYTGGDILTLNDSLPTAEALAVKGDTILAVGAQADIVRLHRGASTETVNLAGKTLLPGFLDAHSHYFSSLTIANQANVYAPPAGPG